MRVAMASLGIQANFVQGGDDCLLLFGRGTDAMNTQAFADDVADAHTRAETAERVLEHHLHLPA
ncbi:hypothetical protein D3C76_1189020 [compost metagenome]